MNRDTDTANTKASECFDLRDAPYLQSVLDAVDAAHTVGNLPVIRVYQADLPAGIGGVYDEKINPPRITVARQTLNADLSFLHEAGHFIDHQGIDRAGEYASIHSPLLENWRSVVQRSAPIADIKRLRPGAAPATQRAFDYLLADNEIFARCYAQYIAFKGQHPGLVACLRNDFLNHPSLLRRIRQWQEEDFVPISEAMNSVFNQLG